MSDVNNTGNATPPVSLGATIPALAVACVSVILLVVLALHLVTVRNSVAASQTSYAAERGDAVQRTLSRPNLPSSVPLTVCNTSADPAELVAVISSYQSPGNSPITTFNSTAAGGHVWDVAPHSRQTLHLEQDGHTVWDGSSMFYAMEIRQHGRESLQTGTSAQAQDGCTVSLRE